MHAGLFESRSDGGFASGFDNSGGDTESLGAELGIAHAVTVSFDVAETLLCRRDSGGIDSEVGQDFVDLSGLEVLASFPDPGRGLLAFRTEDRLSDCSNVLLGMKEVEDLDRPGEVLLGDVPDPGSPVSDHDLTDDCIKLSTGSFPEDPGGKGGDLVLGIVRGGTFDGGGVALGPFVPDGNPLGVGRLRAPEDTKLHLPGFGGPVLLLSRPVDQGFLPHGDPGSVRSKVERSGKGSDRIRIETGPLVFGDLGPQGLGHPFHLPGTHRETGQLPEELGACLEGKFRSGDPGHPENAGSDRVLFNIQGPVLRKEPLMAGGTEIISPFQDDGTEDREKLFLEGSGIPGALVAAFGGTGENRSGLVFGAVQMTFEDPGGHLKGPGPDRLLQGLEVDSRFVLCPQERLNLP